MVHTHTPLGSHTLLRTTSVEDAQASIGASLAPHELMPLRERENFHVLHNAAELDRLSLHYIDYGTEVEISASPLDFHLIQIPLGGTTQIRAGGNLVTASTRNAAVTGPGQPLRMRYSAGNPRVMVRIDPDLLSERLATAAATGVAVDMSTDASFDISSGVGRSWRRLVEFIMTDIERNGLSNSPLPAAALEIAVVDGLIVALSPDTSTTADCSANDRIVKRAVRLIDDHCSEPLGTPDIAEAVGVSVRALQAGFKTHLSTTPMAYLRQVRLLRVRETLTEGNVQSVTEAAMQWGITHLGRLSGDYRTAFGEAPSETLQRAR